MVAAETVERFRADLERLTEGPPGKLGVAVSGGPDSLALLLLAAAAYPGQVEAISVDHGLRPNASSECRFVADLCARLNVPHEIVAVTVDRRRIGLQAAARAQRRGAWRRWALARSLQCVLTAHHLDDQAETVMMRMARGAGVGGLAAMKALSPLGGTLEEPVLLLRPLLSWSRSELGAIPAAAGIEPITDPSNADPRFDRTRFRELLAGTTLINARRLSAVASHARDAEEALEWAAERFAKQHVVTFDDRVELRIEPWPREITRRLLLRALAEMGAYPDDGPKVSRLMQLLEAGRAGTLAGIKVTPGSTWVLTTAPPRKT